MELMMYGWYIVLLAGLLQATFMVPSGVLLLLSGHSLSRKRAHARLVHVSFSFVLGQLLMTFLLACVGVYFVGLFDLTRFPVFTLLSASYLMVVGLWVGFFYYRAGKKGTSLWLPRVSARYLNERAAATQSGAESFVLAAYSVLLELPFSLALIIIAAGAIAPMSPQLQLVALIVFSLLASLNAGFLFTRIGGGQTIANLQAVRERFKRFWQYTAGLCMVILGACIGFGAMYEFLLARGVHVW